MDYLIVVLTICTVQAFKEYVPSNFIPLASVLVGLVISIVFGLLTKASGPDMLEVAIQGVTAGLMASGSYDLVKGIWLEGKGE